MYSSGEHSERPEVKDGTMEGERFNMHIVNISPA